MFGGMDSKKAKLIVNPPTVKKKIPLQTTSTTIKTLSFPVLSAMISSPRTCQRIILPVRGSFVAINC